MFYNLSILCQPVQGVEGILEEERQEAVSPGVCPEQVEDSEPGTAEADPGQELELECRLETEFRITNHLHPSQ